MKRKIIIIFFLLFPFFVSAYTKEDIISLVSDKKMCDSTSSNMYETYLNTYTRILNSKDINEELANQIYEKIAYSLNTLEDNKVCKIEDYQALNTDLKSKIYNSLYSAMRLILKANDLENKKTNIKISNDQTIEIFENGKLVDRLDLTKTKFNYVGYSKKFVFLKYALIISLIMLILFLKFIKKKQLKNLLVILLNLNIFALIIYIFVGTKVYDLYSLINIMSIKENNNVFNVKVKDQKIIEKPSYGSNYGTLKIANLNIELPIYYGETKEILKHGVASNTNMPGENKRIIMSAHNSSKFLKNIKDIKNDELIKIETTYGKFEYQVFKTEILNEDEFDKLSKSDKELLVIYTCYPFDEVIYSNKRFVVYAYLIEEDWYND
jgi:sortase A